MTITLYWWMVPLALTAVGIVAFKLDERSVGYMSMPWVGFAALAACLFGALMFIAGYYTGGAT